MHLTATQTELLAPAGDWECLRAAVANGADAVYFGLTRFNARQRAANFSLPELPEVADYLHARNAKAYVTLNTLIFSDELAQAAEYAAAIARAGADGVIVQDLGLARLITQLAPTLPIHASTQMTQTEAGGIRFLRSLGISRVILARELTKAEMARIAAAARVPLEVFVHGALCISYSGQCLASESLWGRSANRGLCAQACRLPYTLVVDGVPSDQGGRDYLLSAQDLAAYDRIADLVHLGIAGFKIEGRLKGAHYVAATTRVYRAAIDAALRQAPFQLSPVEQDELTMGFSRGLGHGFLDGVDHQRLVHGRFSKSRGLLLGTVVGKTRRGVVVALERQPGHLAAGPSYRHAAEQARLPLLVKPGDGVVFDQGDPELDEQGGRVFSVRGLDSNATGRQGSGKPSPARSSKSKRQALRTHVELTFGRGTVDFAAVSIGAKVWKTDDPHIRRRLARSARGGHAARRVPLHVRAVAACGQPLRITVSDDTGLVTELTSNQPLRGAEKHPLTNDLLRQQFGRLGNTPFELGKVELIGVQGRAESLPVMAPKSLLNDLRRQGVKQLLEQRLAAHRHVVQESDALERLREEIRRHYAMNAAVQESQGAASDAPRLHVLVRTPEQFAEARDWTPPAAGISMDVLYCDFAEMTAYETASSIGSKPGVPLAFATPRILMPGEEDLLEKIAGLNPNAMLVRNLGAIEFLKRRFPEMALIGDFSLNVANDITAFLLNRSGLRRLTASCDLNRNQLAAMLRRLPSGLIEVVLHQHMPMFHTRHCLAAASLSGAADCRSCDRPCRRHRLGLRDRHRVDHPLLTDITGRSSVFNAALQTGAEFIDEMQRAGCRDFRIEMLDESARETRELLDCYASRLAGLADSAETMRRLRGVSSGPLTPGAFAFE